MRQNYCSVQESIVTIEGRAMQTYGITVTGPEGCTTVADISPDAAEVAALCARLNRADVSPRHLADVVQDYLHDSDRIG